MLCTIALFLFNVHDFAFRLILKDVEYWCKVPAPPPHSNIFADEWRGLFLLDDRVAHPVTAGVTSARRNRTALLQRGYLAKSGSTGTTTSRHG